MNNRPKVFVSTYPYGVHDNTPLTILEQGEIDYFLNPEKRKLKPEEVAEIAKAVDGIIAGTEDLMPLLKKNSKLKFISRVGIGLDAVPVAECQSRGIRVSYTPDAVTMAVAELTIGLMISGTRHILKSDRELRAGGWSRPIGTRIGESVIGIIGLGRVGKNVLRLVSAFKPKKILLNDLMDKAKEVETILGSAEIPYEFESKERIYAESNILSLHIPSTKITRNLITSREMELFRKDLFLINTSRGGIVNELDLHRALKEKKILGAAIDVFETEPYKGNLTELENVILTQHMGSCSFDCRYLMETQSAAEMVRFFKGEPLINEIPYDDYI